MPQQLAEIGHNVQRLPNNATDKESSRVPPKRHSFNSSGSPLLLASAKVSPRFMADTFASSSARRTPTLSRLPCRSLTPTLSTTMGSNGKTRNWVTSAANRIGIGRPEVTKLSIRTKDELMTEKLRDTSLKNLQSNAIHEKPLPSPPIAQIITSSPKVVGRSLIDASTPPLRYSPEESGPQNWPALSPEKPNKAINMKDIAQRDPAEQFPVLSKPASNDSLSSSASTVKVKRDDTKPTLNETGEYITSTSDHGSNEHVDSDSKVGETEFEVIVGEDSVKNHEAIFSIDPMSEIETIFEEASDVKLGRSREICPENNTTFDYESDLEVYNSSSAQNQVSVDDRERLGCNDALAHSATHPVCKNDSSPKSVTLLNMKDEFEQAPAITEDNVKQEEYLFSGSELAPKRQSQATYRICTTSQDASIYDTAAQSTIDLSQSPQTELDTESVLAYENDISDTLSTIYSAPSSTGSPAHNCLGQLNRENSLPEQRCTPSNFSRLKPKNSAISLSVDTNQDVNDIYRIKRLSPHYAGDDCGPVLTVYEGAENVIMGGDKNFDANENGRWSSCKKKLSYNAIKRRSQSGCSESSSHLRGRSQFDFNFSNEESSSDEQTLANYSSPTSPDLYVSTDTEGVSNDKQSVAKTYGDRKGPFRASSLRSVTKSYERKERPTSIGYPATTRPNTSGGTSVTTFPPRISSLSQDTVFNSKASVIGSRKTAIKSPVVRLSRQSLTTESSLSVNGTTPKSLSSQNGRNPSKTKAAFSNLRGLFHKSPGTRKGVQRALPANTLKHFRANGKGSPQYSRSTSNGYQSNVAAKRISIQKSTPSKTQTSPNYVSKRTYSLSKDTKRTDRGRSSSEQQANSVTELSTLVATILENARQVNNAEESAGLIAITQIIVQTIAMAKTCETKMIMATQAAREAVMSYNITQQNLKELLRLLKQSDSMKNFFS